MRLGGVVVGIPGGDHDTSLGLACEDRLVQKFILNPPVEALDVTVLHRLAGGGRCSAPDQLAGFRSFGALRHLCGLPFLRGTANGFPFGVNFVKIC